MKSAICRRAQMLEELFPFFICSWMRPSSSSLKDYKQAQRRWFPSASQTGDHGTLFQVPTPPQVSKAGATLGIPGPQKTLGNFTGI